MPDEGVYGEVLVLIFVRNVGFGDLTFVEHSRHRGVLCLVFLNNSKIIGATESCVYYEYLRIRIIVEEGFT